MIGFEHNTCEDAAHGSGSSNNIPPPEKKCLKRMAQETGEDQSKKRKKWIENLSVLSSEDEEEFADTAASHKKEKQSVLENNAIYLRFPYYMGSDNSDDEDEIKYFPDNSSKKGEIKRVASSSDEMNEISKVNQSYKHTKRKQKSNQYVKKRVEYSHSKHNVSVGSGTKQYKLKSGSHNDGEENSSLNNNENKESSKRALKCKDNKSANTRPNCEKSKNSKLHSKKSSNKTTDFSTAVTKRLEDNVKEAPKNTSLRQCRAKAFGSVASENFIDEKEEGRNVGEQKDEEFQLDNHNSSRFLDSSSENSNTEISLTKTKRNTYRRINVLCTSSSSSDSDDTPKSSVAQNLQQSENPCSNEVQSKSFNKPETKLKPTVCLSSEEENDDSSLSEPPKGKCEKVFKTIDPAESTNYVSGSNFQTKPTVNANAWKSIAIADIKAQFNKQSKVEELKRKLVPSNAPSVAIYKKIQKREMLRNNLKPKGPISRPKLYHNQGSLHNNENNSCEVKLDDVPSTSTSHRHDQNLVDSTLNNQIMESTDSKNCKSMVHLGIPERRDSLAESIEENAEKLHLPQIDLQFNLDSSPLDNDTNTSIYSKKIRQAHNKGLKVQNDHKKLNPQKKISNQNLKHIQSSKENQSKELRHIPNDASKNFDVLGNIMSQMDNNPFKIQKPANKKPDPTTEMLGWFPARSNASLCGQTQNATGLQQPRIDEFQLKHNMPMGMTLPAVNRTTVVTSNTLNPSYNPLCSALVSSSNTNKTGIENHTDVELKNKEVLNVSKSKQTSKIEENASVTTSVSSSGGKFVPFYSAPQEDYVGDDIRSKSKIANTKSSIVKRFTESKSNNKSSSSNNKPSYSNNNKGYDSSLDGLSKNPISQEPKVSQVLQNNKGLPSAVDKSENTNHLAKRTTNPSTNQSNNGKNNLEPTKPSEELLKVGLPQPQVLSPPGFARGNGAIRNEFKKNNSNINNDKTPKGIRVRIRGTEYRIAKKTSDNLPTKDGGVNAGQSEASTAGQTSSSKVKDFTTVSDKVKAQTSEVVTRMANETGEAPVTPVSSSSTTSSSSLNNSSTSTDDSSSESSDEGGKPSSVEGSASGSRSTSPGQCTLKDPGNIAKSFISFQTEDIQSHINTQVQARDAPTYNKKHLSLQPVQDPLSCSKMKAISSSLITNNKRDDVIILSGSSDSDSSDVLQYKGIDPQLPDEVGKIEKPLDSRMCHAEELTDVNTVPQAEKSELNSDKVGKIRVKSLKELGVIHDNLNNENALEPTPVHDVSEAQNKEQQKQIHGVLQAQSKEQQKQIHKVSQAQSKEQQKSQLDTPSSSTANIVSHQFIHQLVTNFLSSDKTNSDNQLTLRMPEKPNLCTEMPVKKPTKPITTIFLPVVPIAVINPANSVRVRPIVSMLNQEKNKESSLNPGTGNSSHVEPSVSSQTISSGSVISSNQETSRNPAEVEAMLSPSEDVQSLFFKLCDELFTEVVLFKIPKLADDLHLLIAYDIMKEERLKKIDQLINPDTIASEKRRAEKEFADMIKIRGQSFVPLFMTIVKKIHKNHLKALLMAVYFRIVQQLERIDPVNGIYRFKIKDIINSMLLKNRLPDWDVKQQILTYFEADLDMFLSHFRFIEDLLEKYGNFVVQRLTAEVPNKNNAIETSQPNMETPGSSQRINEGIESSVRLPLGGGAQSVNLSGLSQTSDQTPKMPPKPPPPAIGNLDQVFLKRNHQKK